MNEIRKLNKINLDFDLAWKYVKEHLVGGNELSLTLLNLIDFSKGHFYTLLPEEADLANLYEFNLSEVLPQGPIKEFHVLGGFYRGVYKNTINHELTHVLSKRIQDENLICFFEDVMCSPADPGLDDWHTEEILHSFENNIYYIINKHNCSLENLLKCIRCTNAIWHCVFILSKYREETIYQEELSKEQFLQITQGLTHTFIGAYDAQGYIIWEPN